MKRLFTHWLTLLSLLSSGLSFVQASEVKIAAAASLTFVLENIVDQFQQETGHKVKVSYASSSTLTHQIMQGAPFEIFLSADESYVKRLQEKNVTKNDGKIYAYGQLTIFIPNEQHKTSAALPNPDLSELKLALENNTIKHFSIPNPALAPYGRIAKQALEQANIWKEISPLLILGENASQTAMFVNTQAVDGALLPHSLAIVLHQKGLGNFQLVSNKLYSRLNQRMLLLDGASETAHLFYNYLLQDRAQKIFVENGLGSILSNVEIKK